MTYEADFSFGAGGTLQVITWVDTVRVVTMIDVARMSLQVTIKYAHP